MICLRIDNRVKRGVLAKKAANIEGQKQKRKKSPNKITGRLFEKALLSFSFISKTESDHFLYIFVQHMVTLYGYIYR